MEKKYYPTIGLEIHAQLKTNTKMFCSCKNDPDEEKPNVNICPVCTAHPGALPVLNKKAIESVIKVGLAVDGKIADFTEFDRKNYFYPDIPKGYQISQYKYPIVSGGQVLGFEITRVHLEEDTANNKHREGLSDVGRPKFGRPTSDAGYSLIDFNRAGVPLMELVSEPRTFENGGEAGSASANFARELQLILRYLNVSEANMEKGEMRVEANISVSSDPKRLGIKVEVKNLNSFRSVEKAILFELRRMIELYENRKEGEIVQETRGWDESRQKTFSQRKKESSQDYRYFPDPDLPKLHLHRTFSAQGGPASGWDLEKMKKELPELPMSLRARLKNDFGIKDEDIEIYVNDLELGTKFSAIAENLVNKEKIKIASNLITTDFLGLQKIKTKARLPSALNFTELVNLFSEGKISSRAAKDILAIIIVEDESPLKIATKLGLLQSSDKMALKEMAEKIIKINPKVVADYKGGKEQALMSLLGGIMKETKGSANPAVAKQILIDLLTRP